LDTMEWPTSSEEEKEAAQRAGANKDEEEKLS
jgi:hypothetical protein